jgi:DNA-binding Lrp family transcriptional regulator
LEFRINLSAQLTRLFDYFKSLDETNAKMLEALGKLGIRNITLLANSTKLPITTVSFRLKKLRKEKVLVTSNPDLSKLGLAKAFLIATASLGRQETLLEVIRNTDYWTYIIRCYGKFDGYCAYFAFPASHMKELEKYMEEAKSLQAFTHSQFFWTTNSRVIPPNFSLYDFKKKEWTFRWEKWINNILTGSSSLPEVIKEPYDYPVLVDKKDLLIIKELQKDESIELKKLAEIVGITPQSVSFRYHKHILGRNLIIDHAVDIYPFPPQIADLYVFIIDFKNERNLAKFANICEKSPFVVSYTKIIGRDSLIVNVYILKTEFPNLIKSLNCLFTDNFIRNFTYATLDPTSYRRQTISYEYFENGKWIYNSEQKIKKLREICQIH